MMPSANAPLQLAQRRLDRIHRSAPAFISSVTRCTTASVSVSVSNLWPFASEARLELAEILDDAVVNHGDRGRHVRMSVTLGRPSVRGPARMPDPGVPAQRLGQQARLEVAQLAFGAPPLQVPVLDGRDTRTVVAAIFKPPQRVDEVGRYGFAAENADNPTHR